jgi:hypothetical protein
VKSFVTGLLNATAKEPNMSPRKKLNLRPAPEPEPLSAAPQQSPPVVEPLPLELQNDAASSLGPEVGPEHFDIPDEPAAEIIEPPKRVTKEQFRLSFSGLHDAVGMFTGVKCAAITPEEKPNADLASDALYDTASEVHWLSFLIEENSVWLGRVLVIGGFLVPKWRMIGTELKEKRVAAQNAAVGQQAQRPSAPRDPEVGSV